MFKKDTRKISIIVSFLLPLNTEYLLEIFLYRFLYFYEYLRYLRSDLFVSDNWC